MSRQELISSFYEGLDEGERLEVARHIVAQGDEAGFPPDVIEEAKRIVTEAGGESSQANRAY